MGVSKCVLIRDWEKIDNLRIDKYYTLVRLCLREALIFCRRRPSSSTATTTPVTATSPSANDRQRKNRKKNKKSKASPGGDDAASTTMIVDGDGDGDGYDDKKYSNDNTTANQSTSKPSGSAISDDSPKEKITPSAGDGGCWDVELLEAMSDAMEEEVLTLTPGPIGLRLHFADIWAEEALQAGGKTIPTEAFLVALAPWLRVAAAPETNTVVFKRTFEGVFEGLLERFSDGEEGEESGDDDEKVVFENVKLDEVQACLFEVAGAPQVRVDHVFFVFVCQAFFFVTGGCRWFELGQVELSELKMSPKRVDGVCSRT